MYLLTVSPVTSNRHSPLLLQAAQTHTISLNAQHHSRLDAFTGSARVRALTDMVISLVRVSAQQTGSGCGWSYLVQVMVGWKPFVLEFVDGKASVRGEAEESTFV